MGVKFAVKAAQVGYNQIYDQGYDGLAVTPNDGADLPNGSCVGFYVTGAGNVAVNVLNSLDPTAAGGTATFTGLTAGQVVLCNTKRILATGTTATGIFALNKNA